MHNPGAHFFAFLAGLGAAGVGIYDIVHVNGWADRVNGSGSLVSAHVGVGVYVVAVGGLVAVVAALVKRPAESPAAHAP